MDSYIGVNLRKYNCFSTEFYALVNSNDSVFLEFTETNIFLIVIFISFYPATLKKQLSLSKLLVFSVTLLVSFFLFTGISLDKSQPTPEYTQSLKESSQIDPYNVMFLYTEKPLIYKKNIVDLTLKGAHEINDWSSEKIEDNSFDFGTILLIFCLEYWCFSVLIISTLLSNIVNPTNKYASNLQDSLRPGHRRLQRSRKKSSW